MYIIQVYSNNIYNFICREIGNCDGLIYQWQKPYNYTKYYGNNLSLNIMWQTFTISNIKYVDSLYDHLIGIFNTHTPFVCK